MKYLVRLAAKAEQDVEEILAWFRQQSAPQAAQRWFANLMARIETLESHPERCTMAPEVEEIGSPIRELHFGKRKGTYRLLFQIEGRTIFIVRIWHSARDAISKDDL